MQKINCTTVPEMSVILFSGQTTFSCCTKFFQGLNCVSNKFEITHCGVVIHQSAKQIIEKVKGGKCKNLKEEQYESVIKDLEFDDDVVRPFVIEAHMPFVHIRPLEPQLTSYNGSLYLRIPKVAPKHVCDWEGMIGVLYERNWFDMLWSTLEIPTKPDSKDLYCSELVALACIEAGLIKSQSFNVIPEYLATPAKKNDILREAYGKEIVLKIQV
ncbi:Papain-like_cysteine peptidase superfamily [Hexamita inflata]|uniref:Papain-like cysteine peptidase superfamily n=1 Tax=Hexamita inflata TaxID=28002 RepID=A0AA86PDA7_9EUKA|nr:Papain-like cysteine peptidase superfamily [Hexamita inflata]CAI9954300.1 Papain-like cysteine peptidase superfamily [Hexamita inflata]